MSWQIINNFKLSSNIVNVTTSKYVLPRISISRYKKMIIRVVSSYSKRW